MERDWDRGAVGCFFFDRGAGIDRDQKRTREPKTMRNSKAAKKACCRVWCAAGMGVGGAGDGWIRVDRVRSNGSELTRVCA